MSYNYAAFPPAYTPEPVYTYEYYEYPSAQWAVPDGDLLAHPFLPGTAYPAYYIPSTASEEGAPPPSILGDHPADVYQRSLLGATPMPLPLTLQESGWASPPESPHADAERRRGRPQDKYYKAFPANSRLKPLEFRLTLAEEDCENLREDVRVLKSTTDDTSQRLQHTLHQVEQLREIINEVSQSLGGPEGGPRNARTEPAGHASAQYGGAGQ
eukprot:EG_transcript_27948